MPEKTYKIFIEGDFFIHVYFTTNKNNVLVYNVKLIMIYGGEEYEVIRFDSFHGRPHIDILLPDGSVERKVWLVEMNNEVALTNAIAEIQKNYSIYIERFKKWLKEKKGNPKLKK